jgi:capsular polysaccharide biosynthesis protein
MDLKAYLTILWRRKWIILLTTFLATGVAFAGTFYMTATYSATATLRISADGTVGYGDLLYAQRLMNTYPAIVKSAPALAQVSQQLRLKDLPEIDVEFPSESQLLYIIVKSENPAKLAEVANLLAEILIAESRRTREDAPLPLIF